MIRKILIGIIITFALVFVASFLLQLAIGSNPLTRSSFETTAIWAIGLSFVAINIVIAIEKNQNLFLIILLSIFGLGPFVFIYLLITKKVEDQDDNYDRRWSRKQ